MQRRKLLGSGATAVSAAVGAGILSACTIRREEENSSSSSQPKIRWRMATSWPISLDTIFGGAEIISQRVNKLSGGNFQIKPYAAGEIVPGLEVLDAVQAGSVECGHTASYYYKGKNPSFAFGTSVPFGLTAQQQNAWLYEGGGLESLNKNFNSQLLVSKKVIDIAEIDMKKFKQEDVKIPGRTQPLSVCIINNASLLSL